MVRNCLFILSIWLGSQFLSAQDVSFINCNKPSDIQLKKVFEYCIEYKNDKLDYREALDLANAGMKKFPYSYELRLKKSLLLESLGNSNAAEKELMGLIHLYPNRQELHNYLGRIMYEQDRSKSILALLSSIAINPKNDIAKENLIFVKRLLEGAPMRNEMTATKTKGLSSFKIDDFDMINYKLEKSYKNQLMNEDFIEKRLEFFFKSLSTYPHRKEGFFWKFYTPHYIKIYKNNLSKAFVSYISDSQNNKSNDFVKIDFSSK